MKIINQVNSFIIDKTDVSARLRAFECSTKLKCFVNGF